MAAIRASLHQFRRSCRASSVKTKASVRESRPPAGPRQAPGKSPWTAPPAKPKLSRGVLPGESRVRVLIIEDHLVLAQGLQLALGLHADIEVLSTHQTVADGVQAARDTKPDVVLADYHLPDATGAQAAAQIREASPDTSVVILSGDSSDASLLAAVESGVSAYVIKTEMATTVADVVRRAARGEMLVKPATIARLLQAERETQRSKDALPILTDREKDTLRLMNEGLDSKAMARRLGIGVTTVRGHVQNVIEKLGAHSRLEALAAARQAGLLDSD